MSWTPFGVHKTTLGLLDVKVQRPGPHKLSSQIIINFFSLSLEIKDHRCQDINQLFLEETCEQFAARVVLSNLFQFSVVFKEECQVLVCDVDVTVAAVQSMLFDGGAAARVRVLVHLVLDLKKG